MEIEIKEGILYPLICYLGIIIPSAIHFYFTSHPMAFIIGGVGITGLLFWVIPGIIIPSIKNYKKYRGVKTND